MSLDDQIKAKRLEQLNDQLVLSDDERSEWIQLMEDLTPIEIDPNVHESLDQIKKERELQPLKDDLLKLEMQRKKLELEVEIKTEKARIEKAKNLLSGLIWCDDCLKWMPKKHFE